MTITEMSLAAALVAASTAAGVAFWNAQSARLEAHRKVAAGVRDVREWAEVCRDPGSDTPGCPTRGGVFLSTANLRNGDVVGVGTQWYTLATLQECLPIIGDDWYRNWNYGFTADGAGLVEIEENGLDPLHESALVAAGADSVASLPSVGGPGYVLTIPPPVIRDNHSRDWMLPDVPLNRGVSC